MPSIFQHEQAHVDDIEGMQPTVARAKVTRGSRKSTVGSITEIAQYLDCSTPSLEFKLAMLPVNHWKNRYRPN